MNFIITNKHDSNILLLLVLRTQIDFKTRKMIYTFYLNPLISSRAKPWFDSSFPYKFNINKFVKISPVNNWAYSKRPILALKLLPSSKKNYSYSKYLELTTVNFNTNRVLLDKIGTNYPNYSDSRESTELPQLHTLHKLSGTTLLNLVYYLNSNFVSYYTIKSAFLLLFGKTNTLGSLRDSLSPLLLSPKAVLNTPLLVTFNLKHL